MASGTKTGTAWKQRRSQGRAIGHAWHKLKRLRRAFRAMQVASQRTNWRAHANCHGVLIRSPGSMSLIHPFSISIVRRLSSCDVPGGSMRKM